ncbi:hypothetical protein RQP46_000882 [Phenoliferia psychrophenolica]
MGEITAALFLRTLRERPELGHICRYLVIGVGEDEELEERDVGQMRTSFALVDILNACPNVQHLQVRPLHSAVHDVLLDAILSRPLVSLLCSPRLDNIDAVWTGELFRPSDIPRLVSIPTLERLELDTWTATPAVTPPHEAPVFGPLRLRVLRLFHAIPTEILYPLLIAAAPTLEVCDVYVEALLDPDTLFDALILSTPHIIDLTCVSNPSSLELDMFDAPNTPSFDRLLPHFRRLERLYVSGTEISSNFFRLLPPCLRHLTIRSLNPGAIFGYSQVLIDALKDPLLQISLQTFTVRDILEEWEDDELDAMARACSARGIDFLLIPDSKRESDEDSD